MRIIKLGIIIIIMMGLWACSSLFGPPSLSDSVIEADILSMSGFPQGNIISKSLTKEKNDKVLVITGDVAIETANATMHVEVHLSYAYSQSKWMPGYKNFSIDSYTDIKVNPEPTEARIREDIQNLPDFAKDLSVKDRLDYTLTKDKESVITVSGQLDWSTDLCDAKGSYTVVYTYNGSDWDLTSSEVKVSSIVAIKQRPDFDLAYQQLFQEYETWYDNFEEPSEMDSTTLSVDMKAGTASFTSKYTLKNGPMEAKAIVTINGSFEYGTGWVFTPGTKSFDTTIDYTGTYHLTWDILDTETFYTMNEPMTLTLTGKIHFLGKSAWDVSSIVTNDIKAVVNFRSKTYTVTSVKPDPANTYPSLVLIAYGSGAKERVYLAYGQESYRDWAYMGFRFYGVSADESHAVIVKD